MAKARHNLALVLGAGKTAGRECDGAGRSRQTFADVAVGGLTYGMLDSTGSELAHAVGACATSKPLVQGHTNVGGGGAAQDTVPLQGVQRQLQPCACTVATSDTTRTV